MKKSVKVQMKSELEARPIAKLVQLANNFNSRIYLEVGDSHVNAKSIMGMMSLALMNGEDVTIDVEGADEEDAAAAISAFLTE